MRCDLFVQSYANKRFDLMKLISSGWVKETNDNSFLLKTDTINTFIIILYNSNQ